MTTDGQATRLGVRAMKEYDLFQQMVIEIPAEDIRTLSRAGCLQGNHVKNWTRNHNGKGPAEAAQTWINHHMHRKEKRAIFALFGIACLVAALIAEHWPTMTPEWQTINSIVLLIPFGFTVLAYTHFVFPLKKERVARKHAEAFHGDLARLRHMVSARSLADLDMMPWKEVEERAKECLVAICAHDLRKKERPQKIFEDTSTEVPDGDRKHFVDSYALLQRFGLVGKEGYGPYYKLAGLQIEQETRLKTPRQASGDNEQTA